MKLVEVSGQKVARNALSLVLIILPFWSLAGGSIPTANQQAQATETASLDITSTAKSLETFPVQVTTTLIFESPTPTFPPATETEAVITTDTPVSDLTLGGEFGVTEILARFRRRASREVIEQCVRSVHATITSEIEKLNTFVLSVPTASMAESTFTLESCPDIRYVEPNYMVQIADIIPSDPGWGNQYGLTNIRAPQGWEYTTGSSSVTIAILDTGIDLSHLDFAGKIVGGYDFVNNDSNPQDDNGHGTHVSGIAAALGNNGIGVAGVSWGARLMPIKVLNASGNGTYANVAEGLIWAADHGAQIINLSFGGRNSSQLLQDAVDYAASQGVILVAAAGNTGSNLVLYPAHYPNVIAVAATDGSNARAGFSNYGPEVDLSAPGVSIYSTVLGGYGYLNGTSMATPFVAGLAAILRGIPGNGSPYAITQQMQSTALDLGSPGWDDFYGYGLIQMDAAIGAFLLTPTQTFTATSIPFAIPTYTSAVRSASIPGTFPRAKLPTIATPTVTQSAVPASPELATVTPILNSSETLPAATGESQEVIALETPNPVKDGPNWILPCSGIALILLGMILFWLSRRDARNYRRLKRFR